MCVLCLVKSSIFCRDCLLKNAFCAFIRNYVNFHELIFESFSFYRLRGTCEYLCHPTTVDFGWWSRFWVPAFHGCSGESPTPSLWQTYNWRINMYVSRFATTRLHGDLLDISVLHLPPCLAVHLQIRQKERCVVSIGCTTADKFYCFCSLIPWGPSLSTS